MHSLEHECGELLDFDSASDSLRVSLKMGVAPKLSETSLGRSILLRLVGRLLCGLLCRESQSQLSIFVVSYALHSFLIKL